MAEPTQAIFLVNRGLDGRLLHRDGSSVMGSCKIEWSTERGCWRAYDEDGLEAFAELHNLAALRFFERWLCADEDGTTEVDRLRARLEAYEQHALDKID